MEGKSAEEWNNMGATYFMEGRWEEAQACFEKALKLKPDYPTLLNNMGMLAHQQKTFRKAAELFKKANQLKPSPTYLTNLGNALCMLKDFDAAEKAYLAALDISSMDEKALLSIAKLYEHLGDLKKAEHFFKELANYKKNTVAKWELGTFYFRQKEYEASLMILYAIAQEVQSLQVWLTIGRAEFLQQNFGLAEQSIKSALVIEPEHPDSLHQWGLILLAKKDHVKACGVLEKAVRLKPNSMDWKLDLALTLANGKEFQRAEQYLKEILETQPENQKARNYLQLIQENL